MITGFVPVPKRSTFHEAVRFLLQKHHRAFIAGMHSSMGGVDLTADRERQHAEQMLDAAIEDFEHLITVTIDRRVTACLPPNTYHMGGKL